MDNLKNEIIKDHTKLIQIYAIRGDIDAIKREAASFYEWAVIAANEERRKNGS